MHDSITHIGFDVHSQTIEVAIADHHHGEGGGEVRLFGRIRNRFAAVASLVKKLSANYDKLCFWYEAGPTGYGVFRQLIAAGHECHVVAPSKIPKKPGDHIKTDRRDAMNLARLGRAGDLTRVWVPEDVSQDSRL